MDSVSGTRKLSFEEMCDVVGQVAARYGVDKVYIFGSRARGDEREGSDYDFYIKPGNLRGLIKLSGLISALADALGAEVDVIPEGSADDEFVKEIFRERRLVYEA
ncbi:MAG: nucleotidyltransferase domain-containing protein [Methanomassiliicoccaceae archaeon]|jgi:predicted nucleotidyltransferase|nr:nucleotidyltransferase domain-containing protein [Methanomassiliicoccaceae archaeon]